MFTLSHRSHTHTPGESCSSASVAQGGERGETMILIEFIDSNGNPLVAQMAPGPPPFVRCEDILEVVGGRGVASNQRGRYCRDLIRCKQAAGKRPRSSITLATVGGRVVGGGGGGAL